VRVLLLVEFYFQAVRQFLLRGAKDRWARRGNAVADAACRRPSPWTSRLPSPRPSPQRAVSTAANDCRARGDALRAQLETTTEERDEYQNSVIKLEQQLKEAKDERDAATKAAGVIQAKLDAANEDIEKNGVILEEKDVFIKTLIQTPKGKQ
jgi:septal ring factor EnvC (AmiA/AmiB activator)